MLVVLSTVQAGEAQRILFIGNSFTFGNSAEIKTFRAKTVTDLNGSGLGGIPALFKALTLQADLDYNVSLETEPGSSLDFHLEKRRALIDQSWDAVCMHGFSTLDAKHPGDPTLLIDTVGRTGTLLHRRNAAVRIFLTATWARADQIYPAKGRWYGKDVRAMTMDIRNAYDQAAAACPYISGVIPVGEAWLQGMLSGFADPNPYDGIAAGSVNLWGKDSYHGSVLGYYLAAVTTFAQVTGRDPRTLGSAERAAVELGLTPDQVTTIQQIAWDQVGGKQSK